MSAPARIILLSTLASFTLTLSIYSLILHRNPLNRLGFAIFISVIPALATAIIVKLHQLPWQMSLVVYLLLWFSLVLSQSIIRLVL